VSICEFLALAIMHSELPRLIVAQEAGLLQRCGKPSVPSLSK